MECQVCGGELMELGGLGSLIWYRCRNCGMECSKKVEVKAADEDQ